MIATHCDAHTHKQCVVTTVLPPRNAPEVPFSASGQHMIPQSALRVNSTPNKTRAGSRTAISSSESARETNSAGRSDFSLALLVSVMESVRGTHSA